MLQFHRKHPFKHPLLGDLLGLAVVVAAFAAMEWFRAVYVEPREWGSVCVSVDPPLSCIPRSITLWLQTIYGWGAAALFTGLLTLLRVFSWASVGAVVLGIFAIVNQNATWGALGVCLGGWSWIRRDFHRA